MPKTNSENFSTYFSDALTRDPTSLEISELMNKIGYVNIEHGDERGPITASNPEEDCNDYRREYPFIIPTDSDWILKYYPRYETNPSHVELTGSWGNEWNTDRYDEEESPGIGDIKLSDKFRAVMEMVNFCKLQGWKNILIKEGTYFMQWSVWAYCDYIKMPVTGFEPDDDGKARQTAVAYAMLQGSKAFIKPLIPSMIQGSASSSDDSDTGEEG